jgi:hypothetical protein
MNGQGEKWFRGNKTYRNHVAESKYHVVKIET